MILLLFHIFNLNFHKNKIRIDLNLYVQNKSQMANEFYTGGGAEQIDSTVGKRSDILTVCSNQL